MRFRSQDVAMVLLSSSKCRICIIYGKIMKIFVLGYLKLIIPTLGVFSAFA